MCHRLKQFSRCQPRYVGWGRRPGLFGTTSRRRLDKVMLQDVLAKEALRPAQRRAIVGLLMDRYRVGVRRACSVVKQSRSAWHYLPRELDDPDPTDGRDRRNGFRRIFVLLCREVWTDNYKRVCGLYCQAALNLRGKRPRRRKAAAHRLERPVQTTPDRC